MLHQRATPRHHIKDAAADPVYTHTDAPAQVLRALLPAVHFAFDHYSLATWGYVSRRWMQYMN